MGGVSPEGSSGGGEKVDGSADKRLSAVRHGS
jgi:hypothetical protein